MDDCDPSSLYYWAVFGRRQADTVVGWGLSPTEESADEAADSLIDHLYRRDVEPGCESGNAGR